MIIKPDGVGRRAPAVRATFEGVAGGPSTVGADGVAGVGSAGATSSCGAGGVRSDTKTAAPMPITRAAITTINVLLITYSRCSVRCSLYPGSPAAGFDTALRPARSTARWLRLAFPAEPSFCIRHTPACCRSSRDRLGERHAAEEDRADFAVCN